MYNFVSFGEFQYNVTNAAEPVRMVRPLWCGRYGAATMVWGFYGAGFLWRATIWCDGAKNFFALWNFWWPL